MPERSNSAAVATGTNRPGLCIAGPNSRRPVAARRLRPWQSTGPAPVRQTLQASHCPRPLGAGSTRKALVPSSGHVAPSAGDAFGCGGRDLATAWGRKLYAGHDDGQRDTSIEGFLRLIDLRSRCG